MTATMLVIDLFTRHTCEALLTTESAASSYGMPVLEFERRTWNAGELIGCGIAILPTTEEGWAWVVSMPQWKCLLYQERNRA